MYSYLEITYMYYMWMTTFVITTAVKLNKTKVLIIARFEFGFFK